MKKVLMSALLLLMVGVMTSCSSDDDDTVETLTVASVYGYMNYFGEPHKCYLVKENGKGEWRWGFVEGDFPYELGNEYVIRVTKVYPEPGLMDALIYYQFEGLTSKVKKDSEGIDPQMIYKDPPQGDELKEMVQNDELQYGGQLFIPQMAQQCNLIMMNSSLSAGAGDTASGARHHDNYSIFKTTCKGWFYLSYKFLNKDI